MTNNTIHYISGVRPVFNRKAVFSDETADYRDPVFPKAGDTVTVRIRTAKNNVDAVYWISGSKRLPMHLTKKEGGFFFYERQVKVGKETLCYYFELCVGNKSCYYNKLGITRDLGEKYSFRIIPGFSAPEWARGAVMYQIYVDRFFNGDEANDVQTDEYAYLGGHVEKVEDWSEAPKGFDVRRFYGGDLQGVIKKLDYLKKLGVEVIYLNPIFVSPSNHKYDTQDYDHVDPHFGVIEKDEGELLSSDDNDNRNATKYICHVTDPKNLKASDMLFARLCREIHKRGMKVILDGVFNHCGSFNKWMDRERIYEDRKGYEPGAYVSAQSPYRDFFHFNNEHAWPYNEFYAGWWDNSTLPKLIYESSDHLQNYIFNTAVKWLQPPYCVDGWRLDVAADLGQSREFNHEFWKKFRLAVKNANPDALILAEHYGDCREWLKGDEWDTVMNYDAFMEPVSWFLTGMEKHSDSFREDLLANSEAFANALKYNSTAFSRGSLDTAMNELDNHDHSRFLTRTNHYVGRVDHLGSESAGANVNRATMRAAVLFQMTYVGAPTVYYGDEAGVPGYTDPDSRRTYPWGNEDKDMIAFYRAAIRLRRTYPMLRTASVKELAKGEGWVSFGRFTSQERICVVINATTSEKDVVIPVWQTGIMSERGEAVCLLQTDEEDFSEVVKSYPVVRGNLKLRLKPREAMALKIM